MLGEVGGVDRWGLLLTLGGGNGERLSLSKVLE